MIGIKRLKYLASVILLLLLISPTADAAKVYKWVDKDGVIHVTDNPREIPEDHVGSIEEIQIKKNEFNSLTRTIWLFIKSNLGLFTLAIFGIFIILMINKLTQRIMLKHSERKKRRLIQVFEKSGLDRIDNTEFKKLTKTLLENNGYTVSEITFEHFNPGVDFIAERKGNRYYVELKLDYDFVPRLAVSDADREKHRYDCDRSMLVTINFFEEDAIELSKATGCILIDRLTLAQWMLDSKKM